MNFEKKDNQITNIEELTKLIKDGKYSYDALKNGLNLLINNPEYKDVTNKEELILLIEQTVNKLENEKTNKEAIEELQNINPDFKRLTILETKKDTNDSSVNVDYLVLEDEEHNIVGMIDFIFEGTVNDFINNHSDMLVGWNSEDLFNYFKKEVSSKMEFRKTENELDDQAENIDEFIEKSTNKDEATVKKEREELKEYKEKYGLYQPIKVAVNYYNERIYIIGDGVFKFYTRGDGTRIMQTLKKPELIKDYAPTTIVQSEEVEEEKTEYSNMMDLLDSPEETKKPEIKKETPTEYKELDYEKQYGEFSMNSLSKANDIFAKLNDPSQSLTADEQLYLSCVQKKLVDDMVEFSLDPTAYEEKTGISMDDFQLYSRAFVSPVVEKYKSVKEGKTAEGKISEIESSLADAYLSCREECNKNIQKNKEEKTQDKTEVKSTDKVKTLVHDDKNHGISLIVILLEIIVIAMFVLMFLRLDI